MHDLSDQSWADKKFNGPYIHKKIVFKTIGLVCKLHNQNLKKPGF